MSAHHSPQSENICQELTQASRRGCGEPSGLCVAAESDEVGKLELVTGPGRIPEDRRQQVGLLEGERAGDDEKNREERCVGIMSVTCFELRNHPISAH